METISRGPAKALRDVGRPPGREERFLVGRGTAGLGHWWEPGRTIGHRPKPHPYGRDGFRAASPARITPPKPARAGGTALLLEGARGGRLGTGHSGPTRDPVAQARLSGRGSTRRTGRHSARNTGPGNEFPGSRPKVLASDRRGLRDEFRMDGLTGFLGWGGGKQAPARVNWVPSSNRVFRRGTGGLRGGVPGAS